MERRSDDEAAATLGLKRDAARALEAVFVTPNVPDELKRAVNSGAERDGVTFSVTANPATLDAQLARVHDLAVYTRRFEPFPHEAVRDLLGLVRALYTQAKDRDATKAAKLARIGAELVIALDLGSTCAIGTAGHSAAWKRAERCAVDVADCVDVLTPAEPIVEAARARVVRVLQRRA